MSSKRGGCLGGLFKLVALCVFVFYGVAGLTSPWAFHIGGRWTPLLYWSGYGTLSTKDRTYPLYVFLYPSPSFSHLHLDGLQPTGGLQGTASLCASSAVVETLKLSGTIFGGWRSTDDALIEFRLSDFLIVNVGQKQGYFDLYGRWRGPELVMDDRGRSNGTLRAGLKIERAATTLKPGSWSDFKAACATGVSPTDHPKTRT